MPVDVAFLGAGRVARALARALSTGQDAAGAAGTGDARALDLRVLGFASRTAASAQSAVEFVGQGGVLDLPDLRRAHLVLVAVSDPSLPELARQAAAVGAARQCALWLHTSGVHGPEVLDPLRARCGARIGALHPMAPFPDPVAGIRELRGSFALLETTAGPAAVRLVERLLGPLGVTLVVGSVADRRLYHAACALAANGVTALVGEAATLLRVAVSPLDAGPAAGSTDAAAVALARSALRLVEQQGAAAALSGPVRRGDATVVASHLESLARHRPDSVPVYRAVMDRALSLATEAGLDDAAAREVAAVLERHAGNEVRRNDVD